MDSIQQGGQHHEEQKGLYEHKDESTQWIRVTSHGIRQWDVTLNKAHMELLSVAQRKMERIVFGITLRYHQRNTWIRHQTCVNYIIDVIKTGIHGWPGHIARFKDNCWTNQVTAWTPREWTRRQGRPKTRWRDNLTRHLGPAWPRIARDRRLWRQFREGSSLGSERNPGGKLR